MTEVGFWPYSPDAAGLARQAGRLEDAGAQSLWAGESQDSLVAAAVLAGATRQATIGTAITLPIRPPALFAEGLVSLAQLAAGRFRCGLGLVQRHRLEGWYGVPWARRADRLADYVHATRALLAAPASYSGPFYAVDTFANWRGTPLPAPAIWIAAAGPAMLRTAAAVGDGVLLTKLLPTSAIGRTVAGMAIQVGIVRAVALDSDREAARDRARQAIALAARRDYHQALLARTGYEREIAAIVAAQAAGANGAAQVTEAMIDDLAIAGTADDIRRQVAALPVDLILVEPAAGARNWDEANAANLAIADIIGAG